jgi:predicted small metal-binding protein
LESIWKTIKCKDLGGACDFEFSADTFEEITEQSKQHGMEMFKKKGSDHLNAMNAMRDLMKKPEDMQAWFKSKRSIFDNLPDD